MKRRNFMNRNLGFRFVLYFFVIMLLATVITTTLTFAYLSERMEDKALEGQHQVAESLIAMDGEGNGIMLDSAIGTSEVYSVHRVDPNNEFIIKNKKRLDAGEIINEHGWLIPTAYSTYFTAGGNYYQISLFPNTSVIWQIITSVVLSAMGALFLGTLMAVLAGKRFLRPVRELSKATEAVSQGNFSVRVSVPRNIEMRKLVENFNHMTRDLGSIETLQREFVNNVSHEFKTPLASISGFARLLGSETLDEGQRREYAAIIAEESDRLSSLAVTILKLTRLDNVTVPPEVTEFALDEQIRQTIVLLAGEWGAKDIDMVVELAPAQINNSAELLREVWMNLLTNAIKFTPEGGRVFVRLEDSLDKLVVEVEDTGCGMTEEVRRRVFERFYQGDSSHSLGGNGLGLALVKRILELCGGSVEVESIPGEGALFRVILPRD